MIAAKEANTYIWQTAVSEVFILNVDLNRIMYEWIVSICVFSSQVL